MAGKYNRGETWYITWVEGKKQVRHRLGRITEAEAEAARIAKEQSLSLPSLAGPQFSSWAITYGSWHAKEWPDSYYRVEQVIRQHLIPFFKRRPLLTLTIDLVDAYKEQRLEREGAAPATVVKEIRTLKALVNRAVITGVIANNPIKHATAPRIVTERPPRWYTKDELTAIYKQELDIPKETTDLDKALHREYRWVWQLLANSGMRRGEAIQLRWQDVGKDEIRIVSLPGARTKSGHWRVIPITTGSEEALAELRQKREFVLPQISPFSVTRAFHRTLHRAELDGGVHCLRHTFCSHLVQSGVPLRTVQVLAGHSSIHITERYAHLAPSSLRDAIAGMAL